MYTFERFADVIKTSNNSNLIKEGIKNFLSLFEEVINGQDNKITDNTSYFKHIEFYKEYKKQISNINNVIPESFLLEIPLDHLTALIHTLIEVIAGREFKCNFEEYTMDDIRCLQVALGKLWNGSDSADIKKNVICFN